MFTFWQTLERYLCSCRILYTVESFFLPSLSLSLSFSLKHSGCQRNRALRANCIPLLSLCLSFHSFCFSLSPGSVSTAARLLHQNMNRHLSHTLLPTNLPPPPIPHRTPYPPLPPQRPLHYSGPPSCSISWKKRFLFCEYFTALQTFAMCMSFLLLLLLFHFVFYFGQCCFIPTISVPSSLLRTQLY